MTGLERISDKKTFVRKDKFIGNRAGHVVFIPWDATEGAEWIQKTATWNAARPNKFKVVCYIPAVAPHVDLSAISNDPGGVVYIRGHGNPGFPYIMSNYNTPENKLLAGLVLDITDACQRLIDMGLRSNFTGAIKFYSCHSGAKLTDNARQESNKALASAQSRASEIVDMMDGIISENDPATQVRAREQKLVEQQKLKKSPSQKKSMAGQGADYLREKGFKKCAFYGYLGPLGSNYEFDVDDDLSLIHKTVELEGLQNRPKRLKGLDSCRPSVARVRV